MENDIRGLLRKLRAQGRHRWDGGIRQTGIRELIDDIPDLGEIMKPLLGGAAKAA